MYTELYKQLMSYEQGDLTEDEEIAMFQYILDHQLQSDLQGHYGRMVAYLVGQGRIVVRG